MKRPLKISLLVLTAISAISAFLWMRSLASWRPVKIGKIPSDASVYFLSSDAKTAFLSAAAIPPTIFDVPSGRRTKWPFSNSSPYPDFSPYAPHWALTFKSARQKSVEVRDLSTGRLKRIFRWPKTQFNPQFVSDSDANHIGVVEAGVFRQWDVATGRQLRQVQLDIRTLPGDSAIYAISPDDKRLVGYSDKLGVLCDTSSGKTIGSWKINAFDTPRFFSDDAHVIAYVPSAKPNVIPTIVFADTATGQVKWTASGASSLYYRTGEEILLLGKSGCDVLDVSTGCPKRHLPGPRMGDNVLRATPDTIYTQNSQQEILRWRAR